MEKPSALAALENLDYPKEKIEVILARGRQPALQRNLAVREAKGEIIFFLDDDSIAQEGLFRANISSYKDAKVAGVGGPVLPLEPKTTVQAATDLVFASIFGDFRGCMKYAKRGPARIVAEDELILCNMSIRKEVFDQVGGFHETLYPNEENALLYKILTFGKGWVFMYAPEAAIRRARPETVGEFARKIFGYGMGRLEQTLVRPSPVCILRLSTVIFPLYWVLLPFAASVTALAFAPAMLYVAGDLAMTARIWRTVRSIKLSLAAFALFPVMHLAYPCGIIWAATVRRIFGRKPRDSAVEIVKVKKLEQSWSEMLS